MPDDIAKIPLARPGFDALGMSAPVMVQVNSSGQWATSPPDNLDSEKLKKVVEYLFKTKAISAAQTYCCKCCAENQRSGGGKPNKYVPVIMMPILPADQCPFDLDCEIEKMEKAEAKGTKTLKQAEADQAETDQANAKQKKRGFVLQRLTDFDLLSQW